METNELINELKNYQMYLGEFISEYELNEAICDFFEENRYRFYEYGNCLCIVSKSIRYHQHMHSYVMFYNSSDGKSIPRLLNRIKSTSIIDDKELSKKIRIIASRIEEPLKKAETDINNLKDYRHNVYAHWNDKLFDTEWQQTFEDEHKFDFSKIIVLSRVCFQVFSEILILLGNEPFVASIEKDASIKRFIAKLKS